MSTVVSLRLRDDQVERLRRAARQMNRRLSETAAMLLEEALRQREFAFIEFRDSPAGRQAYLKGTRLQVWWIVCLARDFSDSPERVSAEYGLPVVSVQSALAYARAYPDEIATALEDNETNGELLARSVPGLEHVTIDATAP
jgi:uncharacterized protein (DUF433 family)